MNRAHSSAAMNRRQFLRRLRRSTMAIAAVSALGLWRYDRAGPGGKASSTPATTLPSYAVPGTSGRLSIVAGADRRRTLKRALELVGDIHAFVQPGDRVLLKVNAAFASPPAIGATTHPELVTAMTELCYRAGAAKVIVADNPINQPESCFRLSGIGPAATAAGAELILPRPESFRFVAVSGAELLNPWPVFHHPLSQADKVIGLAPVKDHQRSGASLTMKNWYGLLGGKRNIFHQDIHRIIAELALMVKPTLVILDGTTCMMTNGPTGGSLLDLKQANTMVVGTDQVAVDAVGATLLGKKPAELPYLRQAELLGLGTMAFEALQPQRDTA